MKKLNNKGFSAIMAILIVVIVGIIGATGWYVYQSTRNSSVLMNNVQQSGNLSSKQIKKANLVVVAPKNQAGEINGTFVQRNGSSWPSTQSEAYIGINVDNVDKVSKVEWYLNNFDSSSLVYKATSPSVGNLYQYNWPIKNLAGGTYHWLAKVYDKNNNSQVVKNSDGNPYLDMTIGNSVSNSGTVSGTFIQKNNSSWPSTQSEAYIGINVDNVDKVSKVEWYLNNFDSSSLVYKATSPSVGNLYQYNWWIKDLPAGTYRIVAKVYDKNNNSQVVKNSDGNPYVDMSVKMY